MTIESEGTKYCDRCRAQTPIEEWKLHPRTEGRWYWKHEGEQRGVTSWDEHHPNDRMCGFTEPVPEKV